MDPRLDLSKPNVARTYDALLGGHDNFAADRELAGRLVEICPDLGGAVRENRSFTARAADWAARQGIRQYADLGCGLPAHPSAAAAARAVVPSVRLVYVDHDPIVTAHVRALLVTGDGDASVAADLTDPASVLADPAWRGLIDIGRARVLHLRPGPEPDGRPAGPRGRGRIRGPGRVGQLLRSE